jgi:hypothetical protein
MTRPLCWPGFVALPTDRPPILVGDSHGTPLEHAVEMFPRLGGGIFGDLAPELPASQLAILPGTTHVGMLKRADWIAGIVTSLLARR